MKVSVEQAYKFGVENAISNYSLNQTNLNIWYPNFTKDIKNVNGVELIYEGDSNKQKFFTFEFTQNYHETNDNDISLSRKILKNILEATRIVQEKRADRTNPIVLINEHLIDIITKSSICIEPSSHTNDIKPNNVVGSICGMKVYLVEDSFNRICVCPNIFEDEVAPLNKDFFTFTIKENN